MLRANMRPVSQSLYSSFFLPLAGQKSVPPECSQRFPRNFSKAADTLMLHLCSSPRLGHVRFHLRPQRRLHPRSDRHLPVPHLSGQVRETTDRQSQVNQKRHTFFPKVCRFFVGRTHRLTTCAAVNIHGAVFLASIGKIYTRVPLFPLVSRCAGALPP